jgi:hypothetical protein
MKITIDLNTSLTSLYDRNTGNIPLRLLDKPGIDVEEKLWTAIGNNGMVV